MMKSTTIRMDEELKRQACSKLDALGISFNTFVVMATKQLVAQNRIPFELIVPGQVADKEVQEHLVRKDATGHFDT